MFDLAHSVRSVCKITNTNWSLSGLAALEIPIHSFKRSIFTKASVYNIDCFILLYQEQLGIFLQIGFKILTIVVVYIPCVKPHVKEVNITPRI